jgi:hypothetical protein
MLSNSSICMYVVVIINMQFASTCYPCYLRERSSFSKKVFFWHFDKKLLFKCCKKPAHLFCNPTFSSKPQKMGIWFSARFAFKAIKLSRNGPVFKLSTYLPYLPFCKFNSWENISFTMQWSIQNVLFMWTPFNFDFRKPYFCWKVFFCTSNFMAFFLLYVMSNVWNFMCVQCWYFRWGYF